MCGIFGCFNTSQIDPGIVRRAVHKIRHRGPDDEGYLLANTNTGASRPYAGDDSDRRLDLPHISSADHQVYNLAFGFRRLSILDLSTAGHQPMASPDGKLWIVFNGEIYNYVELRNELSHMGHAFRSDGDTEVVLAAYAQWGAACLRRFVGMWAFAILDLRRSVVLLARDPFGIKPLYFRYLDRTFSFSSEIKALLEVPGIRPRADAQAISDYLHHGLTDNSDRTLFADIRNFPGGHYLELHLTSLNGARPQPIPYWTMTAQRREDLSFGEAAERLREMFIENVRLHLRSDVPVGAALSGGVDSSSIVAAMRRLHPSLEIRTFTYIEDHEDVNEEGWADVAAQAAQATQNKIKVSSGELVNSLAHLVYMQDEPFVSTSIFAQFCVFRSAAQDGVKVMLDGQGADELLAGYPSYRGARLASLLRQRKYVQAIQFERSAALTQSNAAGSYLMMTAAAAMLPRTLQSVARRLSGNDSVARNLDQRWFAERAVIRHVPLRTFGRDALREQLVHSVTRTLPRLLRYEDRNSMAHSIESRVPFLTTNLAEFVLSLPEEYIVSADGTTKSVFREAMRGMVPEVILNRRDKLGFSTPEKDWLLKLHPWVTEILHSDACHSIPGIKWNQVRRLWETTKAGDHAWDSHFWRWINLIAWTQVFEVAYE
jgi:asparagine synthase (glutamine-hydrolysing)